MRVTFLHYNSIELKINSAFHEVRIRIYAKIYFPNGHCVNLKS